MSRIGTIGEPAPFICGTLGVGGVPFDGNPAAVEAIGLGIPRGTAVASRRRHMGRLHIVALAIGLLALGSVPVFAQPADSIGRLLSSRIVIGESSFVAPAELVEGADSGARLDYAVFVHELVAFVAKEVLPNSGDEYARSSPMPSRLSDSMPYQRSNFGAHCLTVVTQLRSQVPALAGIRASAGASTLDTLVGAGATALFVRHAWSALQKDVEGDRSGFSLHPRLSPNRVMMNFTFHW